MSPSEWAHWRPPSPWQGPDGRVGDPAVPAARHPGGAAARAPPHPHPQVPGQLGHGHVVPHLHVGRHLPEVGCWGPAVPPEGRPQLVGLMSRPSTRVALSGGGGHPLPRPVGDARAGGGWPSSSPGFSLRPPGPRVTVDSLGRNVDPPVWYDTDVKLFEIQRV